MNAVANISITRADNRQRASVLALLQAAKLPVQDLPATLDHFFVAVKEGQVVGAIGLEPYGSHGLLRSMVVDPSCRNQNIAGALVQALEQHAAALGIGSLYLLTETAASYFERKGYERIHRHQVPQEVQGASEFSSVCPVSAIVMKKRMIQR